MAVAVTAPAHPDHPAASAASAARRRALLTAAALAAAGAGFAVYPAVRPFSDEASLRGAAAFASASWLVAHSAAMLAFVLLSLGCLGVAGQLRDTSAARRAGIGAVLAITGTGLTLPYYGAETFGLHAVGQQALHRHDAALLRSLAGAIRWQEGIWFITAGLVLLAAGLTVLAWAVWTCRALPRFAVVPLAAGFALYLPQYTATQPVRVAHGLLILASCLLLARHLLRPQATRRWHSPNW